MKQRIFYAFFLCLFSAIFLIFASCDTSDCHIVNAEFRSANKIRVYIANLPDADTNIDFSIEVYIDEKRDTSYYVKSHSYATWDFYADITLNKDVPIGGTVFIEPSYQSVNLSGSTSVTREE